MNSSEPRSIQVDQVSPSENKSIQVSPCESKWIQMSSHKSLPKPPTSSHILPKPPKTSRGRGWTKKKGGEIGLDARVRLEEKNGQVKIQGGLFCVT